MTYWFGRVRFYLLAGGLLLLVSGTRPLLCANAVDNVRVAELLAEAARTSKEAGEIVRSFLLYNEAAKRDPSTTSYQQQCDSLAPVAVLLMRKQLESANIQQDISAAEAEVRAPRKLKIRAPVSAPVPSLESASSGFVEAPKSVPESDDPGRAQPRAANTKGAPPSDDSPETSKNQPLNFTFGTQVLGYGTYNAVRNDSVFNPGNQLAAIGKEDFHAALRPDLKLTYGILSLSAKPRADYDHNLSVSSHNADYYLQEWSARLQLLPSLNISYGREVPMWGPSMSVPASNPYFRDNGRNTPLLEVGARDFGRIVWQPSARFAISYIANTALRRGTPDFLPFRPTGAVKADYIGTSLLMSGIYSAGITSPFGQRKFIGGYIQKTVGQALRLYVEGSAQQGNPGYYPETSAAGPGYAQTKLSDALMPRTIVGGIAYTDSKAGTWTGEYIYNPYGYTSMMATNLYANALALSTSYLSGGQSAGLAAEELSRVANPGIGPLRRNYAFGQYQRNGFAGRFDVVLRYTLNAEDRSGQGVAYVTWNVSDHFQMLAVFAGMNGSLDTEYARYLHYQAQLGFRIFMH